MLFRKVLDSAPALNRHVSMTACKLNIPDVSYAFNKNHQIKIKTFVQVPSSKRLSEEKQLEIDMSKKQMEWRVKPYERKGQWYSNFKLFMADDEGPVKGT